jgi:hypothetical protein
MLGQELSIRSSASIRSYEQESVLPRSLKLGKHFSAYVMYGIWPGWPKIKHFVGDIHIYTLQISHFHHFILCPCPFVSSSQSSLCPPLYHPNEDTSVLTKFKNIQQRPRNLLRTNHLLEVTFLPPLPSHRRRRPPRSPCLRTTGHATRSGMIRQNAEVMRVVYLTCITTYLE